MKANIAIVFVGYLLTVGVTLFWVFRARQKRIPHSVRTVVCISLRTLPLFLLFFVVCQRLEMNALVAVGLLTVALWVLLISPSVLGMGTIGVLYVIQQWILGWNGGPRQPGGTDSSRSRVDDVGFTRAMLDDLGKVVKVDWHRVYATGMSTGAIMVYRLASELSDRVAAIAPTAGPMGTQTCDPKRPVSVMHFHGTEDPAVPFVGGKDGTEVVLFEIRGGGHTWPGREFGPEMAILGLSTKDISANDLMGAFFGKHYL
ncbi:MAG: alpha/beta hydrolase family esterase [Solirubrobacterales bacterium]